jgi:hypothetical protein
MLPQGFLADYPLVRKDQEKARGLRLSERFLGAAPPGKAAPAPGARPSSKATKPKPLTH